MYVLYIGNKNYSHGRSALGTHARTRHAFDERLMPFMPDRAGPNSQVLSQRTRSLPRVRQGGRSGTRSGSPNFSPNDTRRLAEGCHGASLGAVRRRRDGTPASSELRNRCAMNCGIRVHLNAVPRSSKRKSPGSMSCGARVSSASRAIPRRQSIHGGRCVLHAGRLSRATYGLKLEEPSRAYVNRCWRSRARELVYRGARRNLARAAHEEEAKAGRRLGCDFRRVG